MTTLKNALAIYEQLGNEERAARRAGDAHDFEAEQAHKDEALRLAAITETFPKVFVSYSIGYRRYYSQAVKIGAVYLHRGAKMTKTRGYRLIEEIPEITEEMESDMLADIYHY